MSFFTLGHLLLDYPKNFYTFCSEKHRLCCWDWHWHYLGCLAMATKTRCLNNACSITAFPACHSPCSSISLGLGLGQGDHGGPMHHMICYTSWPSKVCHHFAGSYPQSIDVGWGWPCSVVSMLIPTGTHCYAMPCDMVQQ